ncbi:MAG: hypothetical protein WDM84_09055 [Bauldia sp.]
MSSSLVSSAARRLRWAALSIPSSATKTGLDVFDVSFDEVLASGYPFEDEETVSWYTAERAADQICRHHGYVGGFFTGFQHFGTANQVTIVCGGTLAAANVITKALYVDPMTSWDWAVAAFAGSYQCGGDSQGLEGFVTDQSGGGQWETLDFPAGRSLYQNNPTADTLICFNNAKAFWVTFADLAATQYGYSDVRAVGWAQAARAATVYCTRKKYLAGLVEGAFWSRIDCLQPPVEVFLPAGNPPGNVILPPLHCPPGFGVVNNACKRILVPLERAIAPSAPGPRDIIGVIRSAPCPSLQVRDAAGRCVPVTIGPSARPVVKPIVVCRPPQVLFDNQCLWRCPGGMTPVNGVCLPLPRSTSIACRGCSPVRTARRIRPTARARRRCLRSACIPWSPVRTIVRAGRTANVLCPRLEFIGPCCPAVRSPTAACTETHGAVPPAWP